jgi:TolA-binding protein
LNFAINLNATSAIDLYALSNNTNDIAETERILKKIVELYPNSSFASKSFYRLGNLNFLKGNYTNAIKYFDKVITLYSSTKEYENSYYNYAICNYLTGKIAVSEKYLKDFLKKFPTTTKKNEIYLKLGDIAYNNGKIAQAIKYYLDSLTIYKDNNYKSWIYFQLGNCYKYSKQYSEAFIAYSTVVKFFSDSLEYYQSKQMLEDLKKRKKNLKYQIFSIKNPAYIFYAQLGAFKQKNKAINFIKSLDLKKKNQVKIIYEGNYYKVITNNFFSYEATEDFLKKLDVIGIIKINKKY